MLPTFAKRSIVLSILAGIAIPASMFAAGPSAVQPYRSEEPSRPGTTTGEFPRGDGQSRALTPAERSADTIIANRVKERLAKDRDIRNLHIAVDSDEHGTVRLTGQASTQHEADRAVNIARGVEGVTTVQNNIHVTPRR